MKKLPVVGSPSPYDPQPRAPAALGPDCPVTLLEAGPAAWSAAHEFFHARISNPHTRRAYGRAVGQFLAWCEREGLELARITPGPAAESPCGGSGLIEEDRAPTAQRCKKCSALRTNRKEAARRRELRRLAREEG